MWRNKEMVYGACNESIPPPKAQTLLTIKQSENVQNNVNFDILINTPVSGVAKNII